MIVFLWICLQFESFEIFVEIFFVSPTHNFIIYQLRKKIITQLNKKKLASDFFKKYMRSFSFSLTHTFRFFA